MIASFGNAKQAPNWLISPGESIGLITAKTTRGDLKEIYGEENIEDKEIYLGEGFSKPGTVIFPNVPEKRIEITWKNNDRKSPGRIQIGGIRKQMENKGRYNDKIDLEGN